MVAVGIDVQTCWPPIFTIVLTKNFVFTLIAVFAESFVVYWVCSPVREQRFQLGLKLNDKRLTVGGGQPCVFFA